MDLIYQNLRRKCLCSISSISLQSKAFHPENTQWRSFQPRLELFQIQLRTKLRRVTVCDRDIQTLNQRTSGPVNAHLTPGSGIYFNAFIHVYSPRPGADNPLETNVDVNRKRFSFCPLLQV